MARFSCACRFKVELFRSRAGQAHLCGEGSAVQSDGHAISGE